MNYIDIYRTATDSKEVTFNKLQKKMFPYLGIVKRLHLLRVKGTVSGRRSRWDAKVNAPKT